MKPYLYGAVVALFLSLLGAYQYQKLQADKLRGKLARQEAAGLVLEQKAHEADLLKESNDQLAARIRAMTPKPKNDGPATIVEQAEAVALVKGQPAPWPGVLSTHDWNAKTIAAMDFQTKWEKTLGEALKRELDGQAKVESAQRKTKFWRTTALLAVAGTGAYIALDKK